MDTNLENELYIAIKNLINEGRTSVVKNVNTVMVATYWKIGKEISNALEGENRAEYGEGFIDTLAAKLAKEFGKGFTSRNLRNFRQFYTYFPIWHSVSAKSQCLQFSKNNRVLQSFLHFWIKEYLNVLSCI